MAVADSTGVRPHADHAGRIAPKSHLSPADAAAHRAASYVRHPAKTAARSDDKDIWFPQTASRDENGPSIPGPRRPVDHAGDSDPDANVALRRVRSLPHRIPGAIKRAIEVDAAYAERERLLRATVTAERIMAGAL